MAPRKFQPVETPQEPETLPCIAEQPVEPRGYGEQLTHNCGIPYGGVPRSVNVTINPADLQRAIASQKAAVAKSIAANAEYQRIVKGRREMKRQIPVDLEQEDVRHTEETITTRTEH